MRPERQRPSAGFTLMELLIVMIIIGLLMGLILVAAMDGVRRAEERATQELIIKLDSGVADRLETLLSQSPDIVPNGAGYLATIYPFSGQPAVFRQNPERAQVIAMFDMLRNEMPDGFVLNVDPFNITSASGYPNVYPLNFGMSGYPMTAAGITSFLYPLGASTPAGVPIVPGANGVVTIGLSKGIMGASYAAAAAFYKNLGYHPIGYDGRDNNADGFIDDLFEGTNLGDPTYLQTITKNLQNHKHATARAAALYALLIEGNGPLGSSMSRDNFTDKEIQDTDGDGLPEFVDAWGQPLQFFRWPIHYTSVNDTQRGTLSYGVLESRQQDPLDANQQLVAPSWWSSSYNFVPDSSFPASGPLSGFANYFNVNFHPLLDMNAVNGVVTGLWDRGAVYFQRREYYSRFLIVSSGLDRNLGIGMLDVNYDLAGVTFSGTPPTPIPSRFNVPGLIQIENPAAPFSPYRNTTSIYLEPVQSADNLAITNFLIDAGFDDLTNHNVMLSGGGVR